jgi:hypothetical protein
MTKLFRVTYMRQGHVEPRTLTLAKPGIVSATELAAKLASTWQLANWTIATVPFNHRRQHGYKHRT